MAPTFPHSRWLVPAAVAAFLLWTGSFPVAAQTAPAQPAPRPLRASGHAERNSGEPVALTAKQDRERMLRLLGICDSEMRPLSSTDAAAPNAANYDEAKADVDRTLPDALRLNNGQRVTTSAEWWTERRPEIVGELDREIPVLPPTHPVTKIDGARFFSFSRQDCQ